MKYHFPFCLMTFDLKIIWASKTYNTRRLSTKLILQTTERCEQNNLAELASGCRLQASLVVRSCKFYVSFFHLLQVSVTQNKAKSRKLGCKNKMTRR